MNKDPFEHQQINQDEVKTDIEAIQDILNEGKSNEQIEEQNGVRKHFINDENRREKTKRTGRGRNNATLGMFDEV